MKFFGLTIAAAVATMTAQGVSAQELNKKVASDEYVRNSVCLMMMEDASVPQKDVLREAFLNAEWNPTSNDQNIETSLRVIDPTAYTLTADDEAAFNLACTPTEQYLNILETGGTAPKQTYYNETMNQILRQLMATQTQTVDTVIKLNVARLANKYLLENHVAKRLAGCGSGTEYLAVTPWGDFYPCHQFVGEEKFLLGNVYDGITNTEIRDEFKLCNVYAKDKCRNCFARFYCSGGCAANSYHFHGTITDAYDIGCEMQKKRIECAIMIKAALAEEEEAGGNA